MDTPSTKPAKKPRVAMLIATGFGLGYLPKAPGTWGSLGGVVLAALLFPPGILLSWFYFAAQNQRGDFLISHLPELLGLRVCVVVIAGAIGVWAAGRASEFLSAKDPQVVVIDEVSGQTVALVLGGVWFIPFDAIAPMFGRPEVEVMVPGYANWKYLVVGFILFRVFDIWKPWPARAAEKLPGGWGIMADDWVAGVYAAAGLWVARALGL